MLAAAMEENPEMDVLVKAAKKYRQHKKSLEQNSFCDSAESEHESDTSLSYLGDNQDNEFVIIYTPPKKGATVIKFYLFIIKRLNFLALHCF